MKYIANCRGSFKAHREEFFTDSLLVQGKNPGQPELILQAAVEKQRAQQIPVCTTS